MSKIAMIYEGNKTELQLITNILQVFFGGNTEIIPIIFPAGENIYMLWQQLKKDEFETDLIEVLRAYNPLAKKALEGLLRTDFTEIYLFFDYDGHTNNLPKGLSAESALAEMLDTFNNETDLGKLYINYPMIESLRDNKSDERCYRHCCIEIQEGKTYKNWVSSLLEFQQFSKIDRAHWRILCSNAIQKANCIVNSTYEIPAWENLHSKLNQKKIFESQQLKYIKNQKIAILNSVPLFLLEYFKVDFWNEMLLPCPKTFHK